VVWKLWDRNEFKGTFICCISTAQANAITAVSLVPRLQALRVVGIGGFASVRRSAGSRTLPALASTLALKDRCQYDYFTVKSLQDHLTQCATVPPVPAVVVGAEEALVVVVTGGAAVVVGGTTVVVGLAVVVVTGVDPLDPRRLMIALYAGFGLKLASKRRGVLLARHESGSRTPQDVIPTQLDTARQALATLV